MMAKRRGWITRTKRWVEIAGALVLLPMVAAFGPRLGETSNTVIGQIETVKTEWADTIFDVARRHHVGAAEVLAANAGLDAWMPGEGTAVVLPTSYILPDAPHDGIVINLAGRRLYYFSEGKLTFSAPIGVARDGFATPLGRTRVVAKIRNPSWYPTPSMIASNPNLPRVVPAGPDNPLGAYELRLGWPHYLIHGTRKPDGIGARVSQGCIRLYPEDIEALYSLVKVGTAVHVVDQSEKLGWRDGQLFLEAEPSSQQLDALSLNKAVLPVVVQDVEREALHARLSSALEGHHLVIDWPKVVSVLGERRGIPVQISVTPATSVDSAPNS